VLYEILLTLRSRGRVQASLARAPELRRWAPSMAAVRRPILVATIIAALSGCSGIQTRVVSVPYHSHSPSWKVQPNTTNLVHQQSQATLSISPLTAKTTTPHEFFVHIGSYFQKPGQTIDVDLRQITFHYHGIAISGNGLICTYPVNTETATPADFYTSETGCALIRFPISTPDIKSQFSISINSVVINGKKIEPLLVDFQEGIIQFRGGFQ